MLGDETDTRCLVLLLFRHQVNTVAAGPNWPECQSDLSPGFMLSLTTWHMAASVPQSGGLTAKLHVAVTCTEQWQGAYRKTFFRKLRALDIGTNVCKSTYSAQIQQQRAMCTIKP